MKLPVERMKHIPFSGGIREILAKGAQMEKEGQQILHLEIGRPDFPSPQVAVDEAVKALQNGLVHYADIAGVEELRVAVAEKESARLGYAVDPNTQVVIGVGAVEGLVDAMMSLMDFGDEILLLSPCFPAYFDEAYLCGVVPVEVPLRMEEGFRVNPEEIKKRITPKTRMILINNPNNPTGMVMSKQDLQILAQIAIEHDLYVLSDEPYNEFLYSGEFTSIAALPGMAERTVIVNSVSKTFSMTGWRVGYMLSSPEITKYLNKTHQNVTTQPATFAQYGAVKAFTEGGPHTQKMVTEFKRRRDLVLSYLDQIEILSYVKPEGAFYVFPAINNGMSADKFCDYIIREAGVALVPGDAFHGEPGKSFCRIAYANSYENLELAMQRITAAIKKL